MPTVLTYPTYTIGGWSAGVDDDNGARWGVADQDALSAPGAKTRISERPYSSGAYRAPSFRSSRTITLTGWCAAQDRASVRRARDTLMSAVSGGGQQTLTIDDGISPRQCRVELASDVKIKFTGSPWFFHWQLSVVAVDPVYYDVAVQSASTTLPTPGGVGLDWSTGGGLDWSTGGGLNWGTVVSNGTFSMANSGNADTWPVFTFTGPLTSPMVTNTSTGQQLAYSGTLSAADNVVITTAPVGRSVLLNGADRFTLMTSAAWFPIPAFSNITIGFAASAGGGSLSASWSSASW
jgi:hypothetical protein